MLPSHALPVDDGPRPGEDRAHDAPSEIRTFLIADIRGYTSFTQQHGDEAAAALATRFAVISRETVEEYRGSLLELRGDEALCVFASPRQSLRAAIALQRRFVDETVQEPSHPLTVGIGLDAGEAVAVGDGYRGGAVNLAARLCSKAGPGETLASQEVVHLARKLDGVRYLEAGEARFKGLDAPVRIVRVAPEVDDPAARLAALLDRRASGRPLAERAAPGRRSRTILAAAIAALLVVGAATLLVIARGGADAFPVGANTVSAIDPSSDTVVDGVAVGQGPTAVAEGFGALWVANADAQTVSSIDPTTGQQQTVSAGGVPSGIAVGAGRVWVAEEIDDVVAVVAGNPPAVVAEVKNVAAPSDVAAGDGWIWATSYNRNRIYRIDPKTRAIDRAIETGDGPTGVAVGAGSVWVADALARAVTVIDATDASVAPPIPLAANPTDVAVGAGSVWVSSRDGNVVFQIDPVERRIERRIPVGAGPTTIVADAHAVWVALDRKGAVARIDPSAGKILATISVHGRPSGLALGAGRVWVTVAGRTG